MDYIKRAIEDIVLHSGNTFKSILVTGARQTGKTKMIKELFPDKKYVLIDDPVSRCRPKDHSAAQTHTPR